MPINAIIKRNGHFNRRLYVDFVHLSLSLLLLFNDIIDIDVIVDNVLVGGGGGGDGDDGSLLSMITTIMYCTQLFIHKLNIRKKNKTKQM